MKLSLTIFLFCFFGKCFAQDAIFSMPDASTAYTNPALINHTFAGSFRSAYRLQWPKLDGGYNQFYGEYSQFFRKLHGYFTGFALCEKNYVLTKQNYFLNYTHSFIIGKQIKFRPTLGVGYYYKKIDWDVLSFGDMIDPRAGFIHNTNDVPRGGDVSGIDFRSGLALNAYDFTLGFSILHLTQPDESVIKGKSPIPMHFNLQIGYSGQIVINQSYHLLVMPFILADWQGTSQMIQVGSYFQLSNNLKFGFGFRKNDAVNFILGYNHEYFSINMAYDLTTSDLKGLSGGSYEINFGLRILRYPHNFNYMTFESPFQ